ncbi:hypothetical protein L1987_38616 [Smallanthus sonchifolius]|uniref:Uncharacterized protein n=1 Tax=Smallanthus sonchifolius TaxID=185202 RepID=A0ACB9HL21_9ASTR|nr:hypothetical protein L1987_38616 [Smallanthus sonchifolius]
MPEEGIPNFIGEGRGEDFTTGEQGGDQGSPAKARGLDGEGSMGVQVCKEGVGVNSQSSPLVDLNEEPVISENSGGNGGNWKFKTQLRKSLIERGNTLCQFLYLTIVPCILE